MTNAGPTPQINLPGLAGERKNVGFMSPRPYAPPVFWFGYGCHMIGWMMREMSNQSLLMCAGIHRLNVEHILVAVVRTIVEVGVVLQGNADEVGNRVLCCLLQGFGLGLFRNCALWLFTGSDELCLTGGGDWSCANAGKSGKRIKGSDNSKDRFMISCPATSPRFLLRGGVVDFLAQQSAPWTLSVRLRES